MPLTTNFQVAGIHDKRKKEITAALTPEFASRPGRWHVQFIADRVDPEWEVRISGPGTETSGLIGASAPPGEIAEAVKHMLG